jgi:DNA-binding CsgD family transcriptional regulator
VAAAHERKTATLAGRAPRSSQVPYVARATGWALRARDPAAAAAALLEASTEVEDMPGYAAQLAYEALRAGAAPGVVAPRLAGLGTRCDAPLVASYGRHATALAAQDGAAVLAAAEDLATLGARAYAMEAAADAARLLLAAGRQDSARRAAARSRELHVPGQGTAPPSIDGLDGAEVALTRREQQLVELASQGLTNTQIADRLVLSVRTVESHLYRAMQKLGVGDRREL